MKRLQTHRELAARLARLRDDELLARLAHARRLHIGVGGQSFLLTVDDTPVFVKKIPLTDLERAPEHLGSTRNLFGIPLSCHYGHGAIGFSAYREQAANEIATRWVLEGACASFPLLHHARVLPAEGAGRIEEELGIWGDAPAVRARLAAIRNATADLVLFSEWVAQNLLRWLSARLVDDADAAVDFVDAHLGPTIAFMNARGLTHFDTHFENILTDGERLYFSDFGLALSSRFELTHDETEFLARHRSYDDGRAAVSYVHCVGSAFFGPDGWKRIFEATERRPPLPNAAAEVLRRHGARARAQLEFSQRLREAPYDTPYPSTL